MSGHKLTVSFTFGCDCCGRSEDIAEGDGLCARCKVGSFDSFTAIDAVRATNRHPMSGRIINEPLDRRLSRREREIAIAALGWEPEFGDRYAATTSELRSWASVRSAS